MSGAIKQLILLSNHRTHVRALGLCVPPKLKVGLTVLDVNTFASELNNEKNMLVLIDLTNLDAETKRLLQDKLKSGTASLALLSTTDHLVIDEIVKWPNVCGYFNLDDEFDIICKGIQAVMAGDTCFSSHVASQLDDYYRKHQPKRAQFDPESRSPYLKNISHC
ncbi:hypothetical protein [Photobacterium atrarenae]|uniref:Response regulatory domain-containing protein n=1 Tax=Photobacterium atrarenae TaxID=865757 RepID=A0ABY5GMH6_9GAMM|nr:hypothetical protein [Photobacterium atrarenae]UTV30452.1 hypothetical protein NNL38_17910 [Photobacterium atrarenae]